MAIKRLKNEPDCIVVFLLGTIVAMVFWYIDYSDTNIHHQPSGWIGSYYRSLLATVVGSRLAIYRRTLRLRPLPYTLAFLVPVMSVELLVSGWERGAFVSALTLLAIWMVYYISRDSSHEKM